MTIALITSAAAGCSGTRQSVTLSRGEANGRVARGRYLVTLTGVVIATRPVSNHVPEAQPPSMAMATEAR